MISIAYVRGTDVVPHMNDSYTAFEKEMNSISKEIDDIFSDLYILYKECDLDVFMNEAAEDEVEKKKESAAKSVVDKVGQKVIEMCKKAIEFFKSIINKFKEASFKNKSTVEKLEILTRQHPELKDQVIASYQAGDLRLADVKSLAELDKAFDEVMAMDDPDSIKSKWAKAKKKFQENADFYKAIGATVTAVGAVITIGWVIKESRAKANKAASDMNDRIKEANDAMNEIAYKVRTNANQTDFVQANEAYRVKAQVINEYNSTTTAWASGVQKFHASINNAAAKFAEKFASDKSKQDLADKLNQSIAKGGKSLADKALDRELEVTKKQKDIEFVTANTAKAKEELKKIKKDKKKTKAEIKKLKKMSDPEYQHKVLQINELQQRLTNARQKYQDIKAATMEIDAKNKQLEGQQKIIDRLTKDLEALNKIIHR